jgi:tetratricopeptide (TPR) repeat protein
MLASAGALALATCVVGGRPAYADGITKVRGTVVDIHGAPMQKVPIVLEAVDVKKKVSGLKTGKNGTYFIAALDVSVAKKWKVIPQLPPGYKVVKVTYELIDSQGQVRAKDNLIPGSKQEFPDLQFPLVGDAGRNVVDFLIAKEAEFVAAVQAERQKRGGAEGATPAAGAAAAPTAPAAGSAPAAPAVSMPSLELAKQLADAGKHQEAIEMYRQYLAKDPQGNPAVYYYLGKSLFESGDDAASEQAFRKGLEIKPDLKGAHFFLGNLFLRQAEDPTEEQAAAAKAAAEYESETLLSPDNDSVAYNLGLAYMKAGQPDKALSSLERAVAINPAKSEAYLKMASIYESRKDVTRAEEMYQKFSAAEPTKAAVSFYNIGVIAWNENRAKDAVQYYRKAVEIDPNYAAAHRELARALMGRQDFQGALKHFQEYLRLDPRAPDAREIRDNIALLQK